MSTNERMGGMLIFVLVFLGLFFLLIAAVPSGYFFTPDETYRNYDVPENFDPIELGGIAFFTQHNITMPSSTEYTFANTTLTLGVDWTTYYTANWLDFSHLYYYLGPIQMWDAMNIETAGDYTILKSEAVNHWDSDTNKSKFYPIWCNHCRVTAWIYDPNSTRKDIAAAWDEGTITVGIGFGFNDYEATIGGWSIIGALLTFQSPQVMGMTGLMASVINLVIALPVWGCIGYLVYRLILMAIPFVGG